MPQKLQGEFTDSLEICFALEISSGDLEAVVQIIGSFDSASTYSGACTLTTTSAIASTGLDPGSRSATGKRVDL